MAVSFNELKKVCFKTSTYKGNWTERYISRIIALPITWLLLHTPVTANQVTLFTILLAVYAAVLFASGNAFLVLIGALIFQLWYIFDKVDGQIARYKSQVSVTGLFFDYIAHHIINILIFFGIGIGLFNSYGLRAVILGFIASMSIQLIGIINDCKYKALYSFKDIKETGLSAYMLPEPKTIQIEVGISRRLFSFIYKLSEIHIIMNIVTLVAILQLILYKIRIINNGTGLFYILVSFYAVVSIVVFSLKLAYLILTKRLDDEARKEII